MSLSGCIFPQKRDGVIPLFIKLKRINYFPSDGPWNEGRLLVIIPRTLMTGTTVGLARRASLSLLSHCDPYYTYNVCKSDSCKCSVASYVNRILKVALNNFHLSGRKEA